ncbi:MAG: glycoside hydrolase family 3 C-terminal domain-containing protein [Bacteroidota bacterium]
MKKILILLLINFYFVGYAQTNKPNYKNLSLSFEERAKDLVEKMTLEEKISQIGNQSKAIPRLGIPEYDWWSEGLHGVGFAGKATVFPQAIAMAASFNPDLMYNVASAIADEGRAKHHKFVRQGDLGRWRGLTFWSPNVNIFRDPRWGRGQETYGEDPYLTGQVGMEFVKGLQGNDPKYYKLVATPKHYAVHNGPEPERHSFNVTPNTRDLWETYLPAFEDLIVKAKAYSIMGAYNRVDGEPANASWLLLEDILRNKWKFDGFVVSDCWAIVDIHKNHKTVPTPEEAAAIAIRKGCDLNCGSVYQQWTMEAVKKGYIDESEVDLAVYRLMLARMKLGMFDPADKVEYAQIPYSVNESDTNNELALNMARESMTLLKNDGILPLYRSKTKKIVVVGPNANTLSALYGNYNGVSSRPIKVIDGIKKLAGKNIEVEYYKGCPLVINETTSEEYEVISTEYLSHTDEKGEKILGLKGEYFNGKDLKGTPIYIRNDKQVNFGWGNSSPNATEAAQGQVNHDEIINEDNFSVRWTGKLIVPKTGEYKIGTASDDGTKLWINGKLIIDEWYDHGWSSFLNVFRFEKDKIYDIKLEYAEGAKVAGVKLIWEIPGENKIVDKDPMHLNNEELKSIKDADVAIFVGGLDATWEGEEMANRNNIEGFRGGDRTRIELPAAQQELVKSMIKTGTPIVFVLMSGSAIAFEGLDDKMPAILQAWYPGQRGDAVAEVLFGDYNPAGRLPVTFYKSTDELADFTDYNMRAGKGFTYRYYKGEPLYPFGHGLSYTKFKYSKLKIDKKKIGEKDEFTISVKVKNTGNVDGDEVVQLYIKDVESSTWQANKQLREFKRIHLKKGESKSIEFILNSKEDLRYYNAMQREYCVEKGEFEIQVGASSEDIRLKQVITVE